MKCSTCDKFCIRLTGRSFGKWYEEHLPGKNLTNTTSNFARHLVETNHDYKNFGTNCIPLHISGKGQVMNALEEYEIYKAYKLHSNNILNDKLRFTTNSLYNLAMKNDVHVSHKRNRRERASYRTISAIQSSPTLSRRTRESNIRAT